MLPKDFRKTDYDNKIDLFTLDLNDTTFTRKELLNKIKKFTDFMKLFRCSIDEFCSIVDELGITDNNLFEYYTYGEDSLLVGKDLIYIEKTVKEGYSWKIKKICYNIYISNNYYADLALGKIAKEIVLRHFPWLAEGVYVKKVKRFNDSIKKLPTSLKTHLNDIPHAVVYENHLTIGDLIKLYTDPSYADSYIDKSLLSIYANGNIYLDLGEHGYCLSMEIDNLYNKDWKAIEEKYVFSILLYNEKGDRIPDKWFEGEQKDAPYFNIPLVKQFHDDLMK